MQHTASDSKALIFLHLPKTGGMTLNSIIRRHYQPQTVFYVDDVNTSVDDFRILPVDVRAGLRCVMGHFLYGLHTFLPQPSTYITLLRDPVERIISHYYYVKTQPLHYLYPVVVGQDLSLLEYATGGVNLELDNGQTRYLSGFWTAPEGTSSSELLDIAKRNLMSSFAAFGPSERFDDVLLLFGRKLGWRDMHYVRENVTLGRPLKEDLDGDTLRRIAEHNYLDMQLYEWGTQRFKEQLQECGSS